MMKGCDYMKFWEALKAMEEGKKIAKDNGEAYYFIENNKLYICTGELMGEAFVSVTDMLDYNWEIYEEKREVDERFKELFHYLKDEHGFVNNQYTDFIQDNNLEDYLLKFYMQLLEMEKYYNFD